MYIGYDNKVWSERHFCGGREFILHLKLRQLPLPRNETDEVLAKIRFTRQPKIIWKARIPEQYKEVFEVIGTGGWLLCRNAREFITTDDVSDAELALPDGWAETCDLFETLNGRGIILMVDDGTVQAPYKEIIYTNNHANIE